MSKADIVAAVLVIGVAAYTVLGGADFGGGFWDLTAGGAERGARVRGLVKRSMSPVWEANHVWLIFVLVVFWTGFPNAFGPLMSTLYVPLFIAMVGIIFRGAAFALRGEAATMFEARGLGATFALSSVIVPFCFGATVGALASGAVAVPADAERPVRRLDRAAAALHRRPRGRPRRLHVGRLPRRRRRPRRAAGPRRRVPPPRPRGGRGHRRARGRRDLRRQLRGPRPLRRSHLRRRPRGRDRLGARRSGDDRPRRDVAVRSRPAHLGARRRRDHRRARRRP